MCECLYYILIRLSAINIVDYSYGICNNSGRIANKDMPAGCQRSLLVLVLCQKHNCSLKNEFFDGTLSCLWQQHIFQFRKKLRAHKFTSRIECTFTERNQ